MDPKMTIEEDSELVESILNWAFIKAQWFNTERLEKMAERLGAGKPLTKSQAKYLNRLVENNDLMEDVDSV